MTEEQKHHIASMFGTIAGAFEYMVASLPSMAGLARVSSDIKTAAQYLRDTQAPTQGPGAWPTPQQEAALDPPVDHSADEKPTRAKKK